MYQTRTIKHARQDRADNEAALAQAKAEYFKLTAIAGDKRSAEQKARLTEIDDTIAGLQQANADLLKELAHFERMADDERASATLGREQLGTRQSGRRFAEMFGAGSLSAEGWASANEFLGVLHAGLHDPRLRTAYEAGGGQRMVAIATGNAGADGGFSVPTQYVAEWLDASIESEIVRSRAQVWPMTSDTRHVPGWDGFNHASNLLGGFTANWVGQGKEITEETPKMRAMLLTAVKLALLTQVSNELIADGLSYDEQLSRGIIRALGWFMDDAFLLGTGAGQPLGALVAPSTITVAKETGQVASTIVYENLATMFARMHPASIPNSVWVASSTTIPQLTQLSVTIGTGGAHIPVMTSQNGQFTILTRPVVFTEKVPALGTKSDISLCDFSQYAIGLRKEMALDKSQHVGFTRDTTYYRGLIRADGRPTWPDVLTPKNGDTLSPFVTLAARA